MEHFFSARESAARVFEFFSDAWAHFLDAWLHPVK